METDLFADVDGCKIRYRDTGGSGPAIVFNNGIGGSLESWENQIAAFCQNYRLIAWDMPGHGQSELGNQPYDPDKFAAFGWRFLDLLKMDQAILVGHSMGGGVALRMAGYHPSRVRKLALVAAATLGRDAPFLFRLFTLPGLGELMTKPSKTGVEQQLKSIFKNPDVVTQQRKDQMLEYAMRPGAQKAFLATIRRMTDLGGQRQTIVSRSHETLKSLDMPVLVVQGRDDLVIKPVHSEWAAKIAKNASLVMFEDCGHAPQEEKPDEFNVILEDFWEG
ncbi:MAG: alpha/beta fold hydrolase [Anaerolineaceae bacterium]|nr:alpha/beta fold hydrolase [Anaerolineaceae bacterium]